MDLEEMLSNKTLKIGASTINMEPQDIENAIESAMSDPLMQLKFNQLQE